MINQLASYNINNSNGQDNDKNNKIINNNYNLNNNNNNNKRLSFDNHNIELMTIKNINKNTNESSSNNNSQSNYDNSNNKLKIQLNNETVNNQPPTIGLVTPSISPEIKYSTTNSTSNINDLNNVLNNNDNSSFNSNNNSSFNSTNNSSFSSFINNSNSSNISSFLNSNNSNSNNNSINNSNSRNNYNNSFLKDKLDDKNQIKLQPKPHKLVEFLSSPNLTSYNKNNKLNNYYNINNDTNNISDNNDNIIVSSSSSSSSSSNNLFEYFNSLSDSPTNTITNNNNNSTNNDFENNMLKKQQNKPTHYQSSPDISSFYNKTIDIRNTQFKNNNTTVDEDVQNYYSFNNYSNSNNTINNNINFYNNNDKNNSGNISLQNNNNDNNTINKKSNTFDNQLSREYPTTTIELSSEDFMAGSQFLNDYSINSNINSSSSRLNNNQTFNKQLLSPKHLNNISNNNNEELYDYDVLNSMVSKIVDGSGENDSKKTKINIKDNNTTEIETRLRTNDNNSFDNNNNNNIYSFNLNNNNGDYFDYQQLTNQLSMFNIDNNKVNKSNNLINNNINSSNSSVMGSVSSKSTLKATSNSFVSSTYHSTLSNSSLLNNSNNNNTIYSQQLKQPNKYSTITTQDNNSINSSINNSNNSINFGINNNSSNPNNSFSSYLKNNKTNKYIKNNSPYNSIKYSYKIEDRDTNELILDLLDNSKREDALAELAKRKDTVENLSRMIWYNQNVVSTLLQEIMALYEYISPPTPKLKARSSNKICNILNLFQCIAADPELRAQFIRLKVIDYIFPYLLTASKSKPFEYLRLTSLGVISSAIKQESEDIISYLIEIDISTPCLKIMENGNDLSKTASAFIIQKILNWDDGLDYFVESSERLSNLTNVLKSMVEAMIPDHMSSRLLKHIVRCYLRLSESAKIRDMLPRWMPICFSNGKLNEFIQKEGDVIVKRWFTQLMGNLYPSQQINKRQLKQQQQQKAQQSQQDALNKPLNIQSEPKLLGNWINNSKNNNNSYN